MHELVENHSLEDCAESLYGLSAMPSRIEFPKILAEVLSFVERVNSFFFLEVLFHWSINILPDISRLWSGSVVRDLSIFFHPSTTFDA